MATTIPTQVSAHYNKLKAQYSEIFKRYIELQEERRENALVLTNLQPLASSNRRCWKVVGGVLVEHTSEETVSSLKETLLMLEHALKSLDEEMNKRQKEVLDLELKYNLNPSKKSDQ